MNKEVLLSKTTMASVLLLVLSGVRVGMGDATAIQGVQEAIMALVPIFLRAAISKSADKAADAAEHGAEQGAREAVRSEAAQPVVMPAAGDS